MPFMRGGNNRTLCKLRSVRYRRDIGEWGTKKIYLLIEVTSLGGVWHELGGLDFRQQPRKHLRFDESERTVHRTGRRGVRTTILITIMTGYGMTA